MIAVSDSEAHLLDQAGKHFLIGALSKAYLLGSNSFHKIYCCHFETGHYCLKQLTLRPDLTGWRDRFEEAYRIEQELALAHSFLPHPVPTRDRLAVASLVGQDDSTAWFLCHKWVSGIVPTYYDLTEDHFAALGRIIIDISRLASDGFAPRCGMDDPLPSLDLLCTNLCGRSKTLDMHSRFINQNRSTLDHLLLGDSIGTIVGHRDISPSNLLVRGDGSLVLVDWENSGPSDHWAEVGRLLGPMCHFRAMNTRSLVHALSRSLVSAQFSVPKAPISIFRSWLSGHVMFLNYLSLTESSPATEARLAREVAILADFLQYVPLLLEDLRSVIS